MTAGPNAMADRLPGSPVQAADGARGRGMAAMAALVAFLWAGAAGAQLQPDPLVRQDLPAPGPNWVWVNDIVFHHMGDGKAFLIDGDSGQMLGMLSTGTAFTGVVMTKDRRLVLAPEIYFSRGTRGTRTDVVTFYDGRTLDAIHEVGIPPKRVNALPMPTLYGLTDDDRFLAIYNFTPAQSVTIVDVKTRRFVGEIDSAGCALAIPTGNRSFMAVCGDGTALGVKLDDKGRQLKKARTTVPIFDPQTDPVHDKGARYLNSYLFPTYEGDVVTVDFVDGVPRPGARWPLLDEAARKESWKPGGMQPFATHEATKRLYALMHVGGKDTHKQPGTQVWVYDLETKARVKRIELANVATAIAVSSAPKPLLFAIFIGAQKVEVYDPETGKLLRTINEIGFTPSTLTPY